MSSATGLSRRGQAYVGCVILAGGAAIVQASLDLYRHPVDWHWFILAGLTLLSGSITVKVPSIPATISVSETFVFTAVMLFGPSAGTITVALDSLIISLWLQRKKPEAFKAFFNVAAPSLSLWISAQLYFALTGNVRLANAPTVTVSSLLGPLIAFTLAYFLLNSSLIAVAISAEKQTPASKVWRENFFWLSLNFFSGASLAALLVAYTRTITPIAVAIIIPLLVISYLTYKTSMGRLEDATRHLSELNLLYLSTIETLAMWIDAKDQITHGHIRRVQTFAVQLARQLGVRDEKLIRAIEAAALLHDMGKLAVPEHILNKPGKLTPGEFEKMKQHASVGAQILSAIDFPYPVVPIVRHHHENWDGTGYPDGLAGTDIPIGARILAVVDCFDALTSDRPYRPRLHDEDALKMLCLRRGSMYDPLVVDAFLRIQSAYPQTTSTARNPETQAEAVWNRMRQASFEDASDRIKRVNAGSPSIDLPGEAGRKLLQLARHAIPVSVGILYAHDPDTDVLTVAHALGDGSHSLGCLRLRVGQGVSGWVAANRRAMANADAVLDLGDGFQSDGQLLRSCLSLPILLADSLLGVISLYSTDSERFSPQERDLLEFQINQFLNDLGVRANTLDDAGTSGTARAKSTEGVFMHGQLYGQRVGIVLLTIDRGQDLSEADSQVFLSTIDRAVRESVRVGDLTIRTSDDELLVVLTQTDSPSAKSTAERIARNLELSLSGLSAIISTPTVKYGLAISPDHGSSFDALVQSARVRLDHPQCQSLSVSPLIH